MKQMNSLYMTNGTSALKPRRRTVGEHRPEVTCTRGHKMQSRTEAMEPITYRRYVAECLDDVKGAVSRDSIANTRTVSITVSQLSAIGIMSFVFTLFATLL